MEKQTSVKDVVCWASPGCHDQCRLRVTVEDGRIVKMVGHPDYSKKRPQSCGRRLPHLTKWLYHPDQLSVPLKRAGERGQNQWTKISWEQALDEIAEKLTRLKKTYGPECLAVKEGTYRSDLYGIRARFLNLFGNPGNVVGPGTVCLTNRMQLYYALIGTAGLFQRHAAARSQVIDGCNFTESREISQWAGLRKRLKGGDYKLIVIDPRKTRIARSADIWLQIRPGTDTALYMSWIHVIIEENLYDEAFVRQWTHGFEDLRKRAREYAPEKVSEITWIAPDKIRESARIYATVKPSILNGGVASDQIGLNSIRAEQARVCLRAITGNMAVTGGEIYTGPGPLIDGKMGVRDAMLQLADKLPADQKAKQLGADRYKLMTWPGYDLINPHYQKLYGIPLCMSGHNFQAPEPLVWTAILTGKPYPVKALLTWSSNPMVNCADTQRVYRALKSPNLELHVMLEHFMTPSALLADYVLPAASKLEKPILSSFEDFTPLFVAGERAIQPMGQRRPDYDFFREMAIRLGFGEYFPWQTEEELADYRLKPLGLTFQEVATQKHVLRSSEPWTYATPHPATGEPSGFATPSGKIELYSNILKALGYDPLPFYEEPPESLTRTPEIAEKYPLILITGGRVKAFFHSENRQPGMGFRKQHPDPLMDIHPDTAGNLGISEGQWACIETRRGVIKQKARLTRDIDPRVVNVEAQWWFPEQPAEEPSLHGVWQSNANVLTMTDPESFDPVTGGWPLRALLCKVYKV
ncbi:MAG: molybdopterin-dependent oxidoreductase [Desulfobacterales bacterium]|nr:molybdopterin-dependent oxidoreductase [Desulfobacterales bacterium]